LASFLKYRFPGSKVVARSGYFEPVEIGINPKGFIVSDFEGKRIFQFIEAPLASHLHFIHEDPICISQEEYLSSGQKFLNEIREIEMGKAVFSRVKQVDFDAEKAAVLFDLLEAKYPDTLVYLLSSEHFGTWVGATPEKLIESKDDHFFTMALAGTLALTGEQSWTSKEKDEQQQVTDFILRTLASFDAKNVHTKGPAEFAAGAVKHLLTEIRFELAPTRSFELARELHPTPAVSGLPREKAIQLIRSIENHERSLYAGMIGVIGENECSLFVNLRCCLIQKNSAFLYVGGGFTKDSDVEKEWDETENKSRTLLNLIDQIS
jgi:isochorismate synthase